MDTSINNNKFESFDGESIYYSFWNEVENPKGVVQIIHGMGEHSGVYDEFAKYLNSNGYIVYATDHRGHGRTSETLNDLGYIKENDLFNMVRDEIFFTQIVKKNHESIPFFILGHSMGSLILQKYLQLHNIIFKTTCKQDEKINGAIIIGSTFRSWENNIFKYISSLYLKVFRDRPSTLMNRIVFKDFRLTGSWISNNQDKIREYKEDPYCISIFPMSFSYYLNLFVMDVYQRHNMSLVDLDTPLLIMSGGKDVVSKKSKKVIELYREYKNLNQKDVKIKIYEHSLHNILGDIDKDKVYQDIKEWLNIKSSV